MNNNGKHIGFLESVDLFADTMSEQHMSSGSNAMLIVASDGDQTIRILDGDCGTIIDALSTAIYQDEELFKAVQASLALAITAKLKQEGGDDDDTD